MNSPQRDRSLRNRPLLVAALFLVAATAIAPQTARGDDEYDLFASANRDYSEGRFEEAIAKYETLANRGLRHENLYVNLGSAYFRAGNTGRAILNYERALRISPDDDDARYNLEVAREATAARFGRDSVAGAEK
ncbi:MAG: tetratricopeptide repeat protein, partial [Pseudomonadota bacterium]